MVYYDERFKVEYFDEYMQKHNLTKKELCAKARVPLKALNQMYNQDFDIGVIEFARLTFAIGKKLYQMFEPVEENKNKKEP